MFYSKIDSDLNKFLLPKKIQQAIQILATTDFTQLEVGEYAVEGDEMYYQVIDTETKPVEENYPEIHQRYVDIQFLVRGKEKIGFSSMHDANEVKEELLASRDIIFFQDTQHESFIDMQEGNFAIFYPNDVHRPACINEKQQKIRKVVFKVDVALLKNN